MSYSIIEHTADVGIEAIGSDAGNTLAHAAKALTEIVTNNPDRQDGNETIEFALEAPDMESLAVTFLAELLWLQESEDLLWTGGGADVVPSEGGWTVKAHGNARRFHGSLPGVEVKAITYHNIAFYSRGKDWFLRVLLDI